MKSWKKFLLALFAAAVAAAIYGAIVIRRGFSATRQAVQFLGKRQRAFIVRLDFFGQSLPVRR
jgi:hypothetical protein